MRSMVRRSLLLAAAVAMLVCSAVRGLTAQPALHPRDAEEHIGLFDALDAQTNSTPDTRVADTDGERTVATASTAWKPIRIAVFTSDVTDSSRHCTDSGQSRPNFYRGTVSCQSADILTDGKKRALLELLIPSAVQLHAERLSVQRVSGNIVVSSSIRQDSFCGQFSIPDSHKKTGVADADFVLYVAAGPTTDGSAAGAFTCQTFAHGRPSVGVVNVSPRHISATPHAVRIMAHEILHALGFNIDTFERLSMVTGVSWLRDRGLVKALKSPMVVAQARAHFGCDTQKYVELEDKGPVGMPGSHWKRRSMKDDLMAGITVAGIYSAITIAAMEDTGFYKGNYAMAEPMMYGRNAGCGLLTDKCVVNGVSQFPAMFCASDDRKLTCASDRLGAGYCAVWTYSSPLPFAYQYFSDSTVGGANVQMDYCPYVQAFSNTSCAIDGNTLKGSVYGAMSRCLDAPFGFTEGGQASSQRGLCAEVQCATTTYAVKVNGAGAFTTCTPGATLSLPSLSSTFSGGTITCPPYDSVCGMHVDAAQYDRFAATLASTNAASASAGVSTALATAAAALALLVG